MNRLGSLVEAMPVAVFVKEATTLRFVLVNRAMEALTGVAGADLVGRGYEDFAAFDTELAARFTAAERRVARGEVPRITYRTVVSLATGTRTLRGSTIPFTDEAGRITHLIGVLEDLTQVLQERDHAEAANRAKSEFMATVSHELRTPLNTIIGYGEMLDDMARAAGRQQESADLQRIVAAGRALLNLINQILELARVESGRLTPSYRPLNVARLVSDLRGSVEPLAAANANTFTIRGRHDGAFVSDEALVRSVLANLLGNAAKFTRGGSIALEYDVTESGAAFRISDSGVGIAPEALGRVFEPFVQADASDSREFDGTGLGLTLCRRICERLHGRIDVESEPGAGSTFTVTLPSAPSGHEPGPAIVFH